MGLGLPTVLLTGSVMNGYADSLFALMWQASPDFRAEFARDEKARFVDRYGYRKQLVQNKDVETGKVVTFGSMSDRVERVEKPIGDAPGVLPLFLLRHLLPLAVTLQKIDLSVDVPPCTERVEHVAPEASMADTFAGLRTKLMSQIAQDRFQKGLAGKLWGAMAQLPAYFDLATEDVGNTPSGDFVLAYPEHVPHVGGTVIASAKGLPASTILPKEQWMLEHLEHAFSEGRHVLVLAWHVRLLPRLARLIKEHLREVAPVLVPAKVPTEKREAWINSEIIGRKRRVMLSNPVAVQTGLNNLVWFADELWMENPNCHPTIYRQTVGRVDRIGQQRPTQIWFPLYAGSPQEAMHKLLLHKVAVSMATDGLDAESALQAAGVGEQDAFSSFTVGRQLYELMSRGDEEREERPLAPIYTPSRLLRTGQLERGQLDLFPAE